MNNDQNFTIRAAERGDCALILGFIRELAEYEHMAGQVVANAQLLEQNLFDCPRGAHVLIAEKDGCPVGFALYFYNFSTFLGRSGIYLEDLFVREQFRGKGYGKALLKALAQIAVSEGCGRLEWCCLDWNQPSIDFYRSMGAVPMDEWTTYRLTGNALVNSAQK